MKLACYAKPMLKLRALVVLLAAVLVGSTTVDAHADTGDASAADAGDGGSACTSASSEAACLGIPNCVWGDQGAGPTCSYVGPVNASPGSGDPGGGGVVAATGDGGDRGCTMSARSCVSARSLAPFAALGLVVAALRRRRASKASSPR